MPMLRILYQWMIVTLGLSPLAPAEELSKADTAFLNDLQHRTFRYFWELTPSETGLTPDRGPGDSFSSIAAVGFALTAYPIGVERGFIQREEAAKRTLATLKFFDRAPQGEEPKGKGLGNK